MLYAEGKEISVLRATSLLFGYATRWVEPSTAPEVSTGRHVGNKKVHLIHMEAV